MSDHLHEHLEGGLQYQGAAVWDVPEDEQGKGLGDVVPPAGEVGDDVLEGVEGSAHQFRIQVDGEVGEHLQEVISSHVRRHDAGNGRHARLQEVQLGLDGSARRVLLDNSSVGFLVYIQTVFSCRQY